jgi:hypothetical protein
MESEKEGILLFSVYLRTIVRYYLERVGTVIETELLWGPENKHNLSSRSLGTP